MSYRNQKNTTMINDLPDIIDLEDTGSGGGLNMIPDSDSYKKYIRNNSYKPEVESGMMTMVPNQDRYRTGYHDINQGSYIDTVAHYPRHGSSGGFAPNNQMYYEPYENTRATPSCVDVAFHTKDCAVCSQLYNNDRTIYIITIVILIIIIILLLKRILDL
jgi:hypothetical protein